MHIQFAELPVFDQERAKRFYVEKLGCEVAADAPMGKDGWRWIELKFPGAETALHFHRRKDDRPSDEPVMVLVADDVKAAVDRLKAKASRSSPSRWRRPGSRDAPSPSSATAKATAW